MNTYKQLYINFLNQLKEEIQLYKNEESIWTTSGAIKNSPGNLCIHICGNLNHFFGAIIGKTNYVRNRDLEFSKKGITREELFKEIDKTMQMLEKIFDSLSMNDVNKIYPDNKFGDSVTYGFVFSRLISHMAYHVGQINYHRRMTIN